MIIRAAELPENLIHAFVDALEAWTVLEHDLFMIYQLVKGGGNLDELWQAFTDLSPRQQREEILKLAAARIKGEADRNHLEKLLRRVGRLAEKRNHIVHGRWHRIEIMEGRRSVGFEYVRIYEGRSVGVSRPTTHAEADAMRGRSRFDEPDLRRAEREFRELTRDLHHSIEKLIKYVVPSDHRAHLDSARPPGSD